MPINDTGTGTTIVFATSGFAAEVRGIDWSGITRPSVKTSHLGTVADDTFIPGDLVDNGTISLDIHHDPSLVIPIAAVKETVTVTYPLKAGDVTPANWACTAFATDDSHSVPLEEIMAGTLVLKVSGGVTKTAAA